MNTYGTLSTHGPVPCAGELIEHSGHCQPPTNPTTIGRAYGTHSVNYTEALTL